MLDIKFIRENASEVQEKSKQKGYEVDVEQLLGFDTKRRELRLKVEELRRERNVLADAVKGKKPGTEQIAKGRAVKENLSVLEHQYTSIDKEFQTLLALIPNIAASDVPVGGEENNLEIKKVGEQKKSAVDHLDLAVRKGWLDFERGSKVSGNKFYFVKGDLAMLENAITQYALDFIIKKGFNYMTVPHMVNSRIAAGTGFSPRTSDQSDEYFIEGEDLTLIASAEIPLTGFHADEILDEKDLPLKYAALSPCYRKEAGTYGKHNRGLFRVHQFNKLEMYAFTLPEESVQMHQKILSIEEEFWQAVGVPYRVINIASGDLGAQASKKYDIEYWSPVDNVYRELSSCSNCTDYQARNVNIRVRNKKGDTVIPHTLNGTVVSLSRAMVAIIENFQTKDGDVIVPEVLRTFMQGKEKI